MSLLDIYRKKYTYLNDETLSKATNECPELLVEILEKEPIKHFTRSLIIHSLAVGGREKYLPIINSYIKHPEPIVREGVYLALYEYYEENDPKKIKIIFEESLLIEQAEGVRKTITEILKQMED